MLISLLVGVLWFEPTRHILQGLLLFILVTTIDVLALVLFLILMRRIGLFHKSDVEQGHPKVAHIDDALVPLVPQHYEQVNRSAPNIQSPSSSIGSDIIRSPNRVVKESGRELVESKGSGGISIRLASDIEDMSAL